MSLATKLFLYLMFVLVVSLPVVTSAQDEARITIEVSQHEAHVWDAKVEFYRELEAHQMLMAEHMASTWEAKTEFFHDLAFSQHIAQTWEAKIAFYQSFPFAAE